MIKLYILVFVLKLVDCMFTTTKTKALIYGYDKFAAILKGVASITNAIILMNVVIAKSYTGIIVIGVAETLGTFLATGLFNKFKKDEEWTFFVAPRTREDSKIIADTLREQGIPTYTVEGYYNKNSVLSCIVTAKTKEESKIVYKVCKDKAKRKRI
ncbi:hypothetical protein IRP63_15035 (plasmid) [Clostridium botulinum]|uniref:DUF5698 domain-containing protein n=1 Tax=Clostridium botulinum C/D str. DC5 TaxID=1443128 RepID=A0A0A0I0A7_CLOBO|nr:hypothetical protein [Clostridium botulinum]KGM93065.1 hypothetical protein Z955_16180 [Clostridium botulinum C/D str. DC5]KOC51532.1 hypothetical protein ADU89_13460 [Clostridium botulinum]KOC56002.1 hypothetical protein ADU90_09080 [Clostridium botulinum]MCD3234829.1 hypothetical protein [Clostridium botulinum D/C]MCD3240702.1 hypothetical protein [Clostridium botulinum D/C]